MIALWMVYATLVATILALAATLLDRAAGAALRQRRWLWVLALALSAGIPAWSVIASRAGFDRAASSMSQSANGTAGATRFSSVVPQQELAEMIARAKPASLGRLDRPLAVLWATTVLLAITGYGLALWSLARSRRGWRAAQVDGQTVLLTPDTGPAVIGALRPAIVVPAWSLGLNSEQRALMLDHERQHVVARDPLVLHAAAVIALLMPWNVVTWWLYQRLRLAVELDCDARVLATGRDARAYGNLLLDVCARRLPSGVILAPGLFERTSSLTRRIRAMYSDRPRFARTRLALGLVAAVAVTIIACDMPSPEVVAPDGTNQATKRLYGDVKAVLEQRTGATENTRAMVARYFPAVALGKAGPSILFVVKSATGDVVITETQAATELARMPLRTGEKLPAAGDVALRERAVVASTRDQSALRVRGTELRTALPAQPSQSRQGILFKVPSGRASVPKGVGALRPDDIATVDVSKHAAGALAPKAVSIVTITLKPRAVVPSVNTP